MGKRLGVIGCGGHAVSSHISTGREAGFRLSAVFDPSPARTQEAVAAGGNESATIHSSAEELIAQADIDALIITSPDEFHAAQLLAAVRRGVAVLVDKPLADTEADLGIVHQALDLATRNQVVVSSCHPRRFDPPYTWARDRLPELVQRFGSLKRVELDFSYHVPSATWKHARSLLLDHFSHEIDFLRLLLGDQPVRAHRLYDGHDHYSVAGVSGEDASSVVFLFSGTRCLDTRNFPEQIRLRFASGACTVDTRTGVAELHDHETDGRFQEIAGRTDHRRRALEITRNFRRAVEGDQSYLTTADLIVNTESGIALSSHGRYVYRPC